MKTDVLQLFPGSGCFVGSFLRSFIKNCYCSFSNHFPKMSSRQRNIRDEDLLEVLDRLEEESDAESDEGDLDLQLSDSEKEDEESDHSDYVYNSEDNAKSFDSEESDSSFHDDDTLNQPSDNVLYHDDEATLNQPSDHVLGQADDSRQAQNRDVRTQEGAVPGRQNAGRGRPVICGRRGRNQAMRKARAQAIADENTAILEVLQNQGWSLIFKPKVFRFRAPPALQLALQTNDPFSFYKLIITDEIIDALVTSTNNHAEAVLGRPNIKRKSRLHTWVPTTREEITCFLGIQLYMGIANFPLISHYWSRSPLYSTGIVKNIMSRNQFLLLLRMWCFEGDNSRLNDRFSKL